MGPVSSTNDKENIYPKIIEIKSHPSSATIFIEKGKISTIRLLITNIAFHKKINKTSDK